MWGKGSSKFVVGFPHIHATIITMNNNTTISNYIKALQARAEQMGGIDYALGYLSGTLAALKLQSYDLEVLEHDIKHLNMLVNTDQQA